MKQCSLDDLRACKRELVYKEQLRDQLKNMRRKRSSSASNGKNADSSPENTAPIVSVKAPSTPPKPRSSNSLSSRLDLYGPEIFV